MLGVPSLHVFRSDVKVCSSLSTQMVQAKLELVCLRPCGMCGSLTMQEDCKFDVSCWFGAQQVTKILVKQHVVGMLAFSFVLLMSMISLVFSSSVGRHDQVAYRKSGT